MKASVVVDTNVPIVANEQSPQAGVDCVLACVAALVDARTSQCVLVDEGGLILDEYRRHLSHSGEPNVGDSFFKWLWDNQGNHQHCRRVAITATGVDQFAEFPGDPALRTFDPSDRKFVATALASGVDPEVLNAVDRDWWECRTALAENGVRVRFLCPEHMSAKA